MTLLQTPTIMDFLIKNDVFFYIEMTIIVLVIMLQLVHSFRLYFSIQNLRNIFEKSLRIINGYIEKGKIGKSDDILSEISFDADNSEEISSTQNDKILKLSLVQSIGNNEVIVRIKKTLNSYLINNYGAAVNFSIIKDIIDREVDVKDEEITQSIPTPLYLGLAATMIGIIFGLLSMPDIGNDLSKTDNGFSEGINALIRGVKWAMIASLSGLLSTTILSSYFYKRAKRIVQRDKNDQLSYLQAKLLPELVRAEDTGVSGLKASLDRFAREATKISDNVRIAANQTGTNLQAQLDVISKVERLDMMKVSRINLELFDRLDSNMLAYNQFSNYLTLMNKISENLFNFSARTENVEIIATEIKSTLKDSQELSRFLTSHFQQIESAGSSALKAVNLSDSHFREAIEKLTSETSTRISSLNNLADNSETTLKETFEKIGSDLNEITNRHINSLSLAYNESVPRFDQLDNLNLLPELKNQSTSQSKEMIEAINQLNRSISNISSRMDNQAVLNKLDAIEKSLKRKSSSGSPAEKQSEKAPKKGFFKNLRSRFSKSNKSTTHEEE